jgi:hypothetical protein
LERVCGLGLEELQCDRGLHLRWGSSSLQKSYSDKEKRIGRGVVGVVGVCDDCDMQLTARSITLFMMMRLRELVDPLRSSPCPPEDEAMRKKACWSRYSAATVEGMRTRASAGNDAAVEKITKDSKLDLPSREQP